MEKQAPLSGLDPADLLRQGAAEDTFADGSSTAFHPPAMEEIVAAFPQLEILELIGQGGMGAVYKVRQKDLDRIVALKILPPAIGQSPESSHRFTREARALAKLNHPGIVTIHEFGQRNGLFFILMEFVDGVNLAQLMKTGRVSPREALAIVPQVCDALQYAHDQGIVHRDIKPENLLLNRLGRVKVADFGIAKVVAAVRDPMGYDDAPAHENQTLAGKIIGTPQYMAPEQIEHPSDVDHRADIYALGVVFYQMLTGELPGNNLQAPSRKVHIDVRLDEIVLQALEKNPNQRFQQASVMKTRVEEVVGISPGIPPALPRKQGALRRWWWVFLIMFPVGLLLGMAAGAMWIHLVPKKYEAQAVVEVRPSQKSAVTPGFFAVEFEVIKSRRTLTAVADELDLSKRWMIEQEDVIRILKETLTAENIRGTDLIRIRMRHTSKQDVVDVTNAVIRAYRKNSVAEVIVHDPASLPSFPTSPNVRLTLVFGAFAGLIVSPLLALLLIPILQRIYPANRKKTPGVGSPSAPVHSRKASSGSAVRTVTIGCFLVLLAATVVVGTLVALRLLSVNRSVVEKQSQLRLAHQAKVAAAREHADRLAEEGKAGLALLTERNSKGRSLSQYDWKALAAAGHLEAGELVTEDGRSCLKIENPNDEPMNARLLTITTPQIKAKRYAAMGEIRYENVQGAAYLEMWSDFPRGRFFSRTMDEPGSGPTGQITGTSDWRPFILPFDQMRVAGPPNRIEVNLHLPGRGVVYVGPLKLVELGTDQAVLDRAGFHKEIRNENEKPAEGVVADAVETWLSRIDDRDYGRSWNEASGFFRKSITAADWGDIMKKLREPLGAVKSRKTRDMKMAETLPGAPDGKYWIIQFDSSFAEKAEAVETVTLMLEEDGTWKAAGYFVR